MPQHRTPPSTDEPAKASAFEQAILPLFARIPTSKEAPSQTPLADARRKASVAAAKAALAAGSLALPPGPLGWMTILPEMMGVWRLQRQLVADIAALYGKQSSLTPEQIVYCLFEHTATQGVRDLVVRVGQRTLVRRASPRLMASLMRRIGVRVGQRVMGKGAARFLPVVGAVGVGAYAYYDTARVAMTAIELFEGVIDVDARESD